MYQGNQNRRHTYSTSPFRSLNTDYDQFSFHHKRSPRSSNWFHSTYLNEYSNDVFQTSNTTSSNPETPPHARSMVYQGNLLSSIMIEQTIIQAALASIEMLDGPESKFEAWVKSIKCSTNIKSKCNMHTFP